MSQQDRYLYYAYLCYDAEDTKQYYVLWRDLPGCTTVADTPELAISKAHEAMALHLWGMEDDGDEIPEPTPLIELDPENDEDGAECVSIIPIDVTMPAIREKLSTKSVNRTVTLPIWLDSAARRADLNVSQLLQDALISRLRISRAVAHEQAERVKSLP